MASTLANLALHGAQSTCTFHFLSKSERYHKEKPYYFSGALDEDQEAHRSNLDYEIHEDIKVVDLRGQEKSLTLQDHGFELLRHSPAVSLANPSDEDMCKYLEDLAATVKNHLSAEVVLGYSFRFRRQKSSQDEAKAGNPVGTYSNQDTPVLVPHTDQTREGGLRRTRRHLTEEEADKYLDGSWRIRIVNCWRPVRGTADERPLAMCDFNSIDEKDLRSADRASREYVGEIYYAHYNPMQKWYWISGQTPEEVLLFKNFDSNPGTEVPFMLHSAFVNSAHINGAQRRESLEAALIVISKD
ncbi:hypothetical protein NW762_010225 [Fusarium torreyae]|uniref:GA4 desaturase n=1 Tax=Fusarium torreyae TaxID=1237075 RepID=A0A9W8VBM6_9HYPO|nr:hypothetical protein NW762_010225 [Fusarium torreyae]